MPWPDIFFKSRKPKPDGDAPAPSATASESSRPLPPEIHPPTVKPIPAAAMSGTMANPRPQVKIAAPDTGTRTLPAMHGVILRPPARLNTTTQITPSNASSPPPLADPIKNIEQLMAEADPVRTLSQSGNVRLLKRQAPETTELPAAPPPAPPATVRPDPALPGTGAALAAAPTPEISSSPVPLSAVAPERRAFPLPSPSAFSTTRSIRAPRPGESPIILKPTVSLSSNPTRKISGFPPPAMIPLAVARRKANMSDVARIILPPKREDTELPHVPLVQAPTIVPPSFTVSSEPPRALVTEVPPLPPPPSLVAPSAIFTSSDTPPPTMEDAPITSAIEASPLLPASATENPFLKRVEPVSSVEEKLASETKIEAGPFVGDPAGTTSLFPEAPKVDPEAHKTDPPAESAPRLDPEAHKESTFVPPDPGKSPVENFPGSPALETAPMAAQEKLPETMSLFVDPPKIDPEAHKSETPTPPLEPQVDAEAHKVISDVPEPPEKIHIAPETPAAPVAVQAEKPLIVEKAPAQTLEIEPVKPPKEKREFHLTNGEKVAGVVLSESPEAVYIEHSTLGVVTIPRHQIAKRLVEIILINGDRIVGDIMAETADMLYVRHASLGMLSVPRAQRSTRVVEAILEDGDRILGEVLTETDTYTVIKSATLGTVTLPHNKVTMLNRKIEQIELKALPPTKSLHELKDK